MFKSTTATPSGGLFGSTAPKPLFGSTSTAPSTGLFGSTAAPTTAPSGGLFGSTAPSGGLFGSTAPTSTAPSGGLFGSTPAPLFGAKTSAPAFGSFFNTPKPTTAGTSLFSFTDAKPPALNFGAPTNTTAAPVQTTQAQEPWGPTAELSRLLASLTGPVVFGDERDGVIAKLNQLQAAYGSGKGPVAQGQPPVNYSTSNPYCRFKAVAYNRIPSHRDAEGLVGLMVSQSAATVKGKLQQFKDAVNAILGGRPSIHVESQAVRPTGENECEVVVYIVETGTTGLRRRIPATDLANHLRSQTIAAQLQSQLGISRVAAKAEVESGQLEEFLRGPPPGGLATLVWEAGKADNPDPERLVPWPVLGFGELKARHAAQALEASAQAEYAAALSAKTTAAAGRRTDLENRLRLSRATGARLEHRLLAVLAAEAQRLRRGQTLSGEEEALAARLEALQPRLIGPGALNARIADLLSQARSLPPRPVTATARNPLSQDQLTQISHFLQDFDDGVKKLGKKLTQQEEDVATARKCIDTMRKSS